MLISEVIQIHSKLNERNIKLDAILTKLGGKTYIYGIECYIRRDIVNIIIIAIIIIIISLLLFLYH